ncbi:GGDEF domain-containing protein [Azoarcus olearius]|uniref:diguanylate cyclase n=1 Tax=Azoarcus sp. (strain BH72) TaxID=418699 RepID=A1K7E0_AZOSB|nr:GGDEF domain-containing protein [Azoarcus olearius]CAL94745.1 GGDEF-domain containing protein [Azoarcus olearius]
MSISPHPYPNPASALTLRLTRLYERGLLLAFSLSPLVAILYLHHFQADVPRFEHHVAHELAIALAIGVSAFVCYVTLRCYESSGEAFLRWLTLGLIGFTVVYAPHGVLTRLSAHHLDWFLLYGPASRFVMAACLLRAAMLYGEAPEPRCARPRARQWAGWIGLFLGVDLVVAQLSFHPHLLPLPVRPVFEACAILFALAAAGLLLRKGASAPLILVTAIALGMFAQSSVAFMLSSAWDHIWWLAHAVFASGFLLLSFGVVRAFHTTRAFSTVFSQEEMMRQLYVEKERAESALALLRQANADLRRLAATDPLTGASNRRQFMATLASEWARARRERAPLALLALDIDHFKHINDRHGHPAGDHALKTFVSAAAGLLRPGDVIGRIGGEEFAIVLPGTQAADAHGIAERIRHGVEALALDIDGVPVALTVSVGVAVSGPSCTEPGDLLKEADRRLYEAKNAGRNRVCPPPPA